MHFGAIGDTVVLNVRNIDEDGDVDTPAGVEMVSRDTAVVVVDQRGVVRSTGNGFTHVVAFATDGGVDSISVRVAQATDSLLVTLPAASPIISLPPGALIPISCRSFDRAGVAVPMTVTVTSASGVVTGGDCHHLRASFSGFDTLVIRDGSHQSIVPIAVTVFPSVGSDPAGPLLVDSLPAGVTPWAPTLYRNSHGGLELYFTGYVDDPNSSVGVRGALHRLISTGGLPFVYDGVALRNADLVCHPEGTGIENITILPRAEAPGWRMFYSAGGSDCYGWQVFSAVSNDERTWVREAGVRISNGVPLPPLPPADAPWPAGEGMVVERLSSGQWRMLIGAYEHISPRQNKFQIIEWNSPDQVNWSYTGPVLTSRDVGPDARRSVYSPAIQELTAGLYRMFFTGDNLDVPGGRSRLYTAVSLDQENWYIEGRLLADSQTDYFYSTLCDTLLAFIRQPVGGNPALGIVRIISH